MDGCDGRRGRTSIRNTLVHRPVHHRPKVVGVGRSLYSDRCSDHTRYIIIDMHVSRTIDHGPMSTMTSSSSFAMIRHVHQEHTGRRFGSEAFSASRPQPFHASSITCLTHARCVQGTDNKGYMTINNQHLPNACSHNPQLIHRRDNGNMCVYGDDRVCPCACVGSNGLTCMNL